MSTEKYRVQCSDRQVALSLDDEAVSSLVRHVLVRESADPGAIHIALVDDDEMAELHVRFLGVAGPTDVLTFPLDGIDPVVAGDPDDPRSLRGEIVVSTETAVRQSPDHRQDPILECLEYVVHGVLHLLGYDDHDAEEARVMYERQAELLDEWRRR